MSNQTIKSSLERFGLKQSELAQLLDVSARTVSIWATGSTPVPGPVAAYLRILRAAGPLVLDQELRRLTRRSKSLDEGIYNLCYRGEDRGLREGGEAFAVLRGGKITGTDRGGTVFSGSYEFDAVRETNRVHVRLTVPPQGLLVTGFAAGPEGAAIDIVGTCERASPVSTLVVDLAGRPIEVRLTYLAPLPS